MAQFFRSLFHRRKLEKQGYKNTNARLKNKAFRQGPSVKMTIFCGFLLWLSSFFIGLDAPNRLSKRYLLKQTSPRNVYSRLEFNYADPRLTQLQRDHEAVKEPLILNLSYDPLAEITGLLKAFQQLSAINFNTTTPSPHTDFWTNLRTTLSNEDWLLLSQQLLDPEVSGKIQQVSVSLAYEGIASSQLIERIVALGDLCTVIDSGNRQSIPQPTKTLRSHEEAVKQAIKRTTQELPDQLRLSQTILEQFFSQLLTPNLTFNEVETLKRRDQRRAAIPMVKRTVRKEELLLAKGQIVTKEDLHLLEAYQNAQSKQNRTLEAKSLITNGILIFIILLLFFIYIRFTNSKLQSRPKLLLLAIICTVGNQLFMQILLISVQHIFNLVEAPLPSNYLILALLPLSFTAIMVTILIDLPNGLYTGLTLGLLGSLQFSIFQENMDFPLYYLLLAITSSTIGAVMVKNVSRRSTLILTSLTTSFLTMILICLPLFLENAPPSAYLKLAGFSAGQFIILSVLIPLLLPLMEYLFNRTTNISLLELCDLNHPLMQRLQMEAPGSYQHSLMVATISEQAARAIGANPLLARVCAYFHDIGKMVKADYFTENNIDSKNRHEELHPKMSALIIINHVKEGVNLALRYKLKPPIIEAIEQHHGKSLISFFYSKAKEQGLLEDPSNDSDYRYPGPLPRRKEIAIISMADICEAASRSLAKPTRSNLEALVNQLIKAKIDDNHFIESELTFAEMDTVRKSIVETLCSMLHTRIAYPKEEKNETADSASASPVSADKPATPDKAVTKGA